MLKPLERHRAYPQLSAPNLAEFRKSHYFVEADPSLQLTDLCNPTKWGPQPKLQRGDWVEILASDGSFHGLLVVVAMVAGHVSLRPLWFLRDSALVDSSAPTRTEYQLEHGWVAILEEKIIATDLPDQAAAEAALASHIEGAAA